MIKITAREQNYQNWLMFLYKISQVLNFDAQKQNEKKVV